MVNIFPHIKAILLETKMQNIMCENKSRTYLFLLELDFQFRSIINYTEFPMMSKMCVCVCVCFVRGHTQCCFGVTYYSVLKNYS